MLILVVVTAFAFQGSRGLYERTEGRYALCAREMLDSGNWLEPTLLGRHHWTKPPFAYWSIGGGLALLGRNAWGARLPVACAFVLTALAVSALGWRLWDAKTGVLAGLIWATAPFPLAIANSVNTDTFLTLWEILVVLAYWTAWRVATARRRYAAVLGMWLCVGMGFFTKGPPALLVLVPVLLFHALSRDRPERPVLAIWSGLGGAVVLAFWWFAVVCLRYPDLPGYLLGNEVVDRIATDVHRRNPELYKAVPVYLLPLAFGGGLWCVWFWRGVLRQRAWAPAYWRAALARRGPALFLGLWLFPVLLVFCLVRSRLSTYVLPLMAPIVLATARCLRDLWTAKRLPRMVLAVALTSAGLGVAGKGAAAYLHKSDRDMKALYALCEPADRGGHTIFCLYRKSRGHGLGFYLQRPLLLADSAGVGAERAPAVSEVVTAMSARYPGMDLAIITPNHPRDLERLLGTLNRLGLRCGPPVGNEYWQIVTVPAGPAVGTPLQ
jgi:4-amino-4-deoxy-L-arabinose transferase